MKIILFASIALAFASTFVVNVSLAKDEEDKDDWKTVTIDLQDQITALGTAPAGQVCMEGYYVVGFDDYGGIICDFYGPSKYIFVTSSAYYGNFGGIAEADNICQGLAETAGLPGTYRAWLSTSTSSPATDSNFTKPNNPYIRTDNQIIAKGWDDLIDGQLDTAIARNEKAEQRLGAVWTATNKDGTYDGLTGDPFSDSCADWTSNSEGHEGGIGSAMIVGPQWTNYSSHPCESYAGLYCVQQ